MELYYLLLLAAIAFILVGVILGYVSASSIGQLRRELQQLLNRICALEDQFGIPAQRPAPPPKPPQWTEAPPSEPQPPRRPLPVPDWMHSAAPPAEQEPISEPAAAMAETTVAAPPPPKPVLPAAPRSDNILFQPIDREWWNRFEIVVGKRWLTWAGALILVASASFFLKYAFDQGWLGASARVLISIAGGLVLLGGGIWCLRKRMPALGQGLCGAGLAVIYAALYSAFAYYNLLSQTSAFTLMALVTAGGVMLALAYDAMAIGVLATVGGYLAPVLVASGSGDTREVLFTYLLLLDLGVLAVALFKRWQLLDMLALLGTFMLITGWISRAYSADQYAAVALWLAAFFAVFLLLPFVYHLRSAQPVALPRFILSLATAVLAVAGAYSVLREGHLPLLGIFTLAMSACYLGLALAFRLRLPQDSRSHNGFLALSIALLTYCIPLLLGLNGALLGWAIEAPLLVYLGYVYRSVLTRSSAVLVLLVALGLLFGKHWPLHLDPFRLLLNPQFGAAIAIPLAGWVCALLHYAFRRSAAVFDRQLVSWLGIMSGLLALTLLNYEIKDWFYIAQDWQVPALYYSGTSAITLWTLGAAAFLAWGLISNMFAARAVGWLILVGLVIGSVYIYAELGAEDLSLIHNYSWFYDLRFFSVLFALLVAFGYALAHATQRQRLPASEHFVHVLVAILAGLGTLLLFHVQSDLLFSEAGPLSAYELSLLPASWELVVWTIGAAAFLAAGLFTRNQAARITGLLIYPGLVIAALVLYHEWDAQVLASTGFTAFTNLRFLALLLAALLLFAYAYAHERLPGRVPQQERYLPVTLAILGGFSLLWLIHSEAFLAFALAANSGARALGSTPLCIGSLIWAIGAGLYLASGLFWNNRAARLSGLFPLGVAFCLSWQIWDRFAMYSEAAGPQLMFFNLRFAVSLLVVMLIFTYAYALRNRKAAVGSSDRALGGWLYGTADILMLVLLSFEAYYFYKRMSLPHQQQDELALVSLSIVWGVYALALLVAGFALRNRPLRMSALALFGITTVKLLWQDLAYLEPAYRLASSVLLGLLLIAASYLYHRISRRLEGPPTGGALPGGDAAENKAGRPAGDASGR